MKTSSGLGIAALIIAVISLFIPLLGLYSGLVALVVATIAAFFGDKGLTIATVVVSFVGYFFLSPSLAMATMGDSNGMNGFWLAIIALLIAPFVGMFIHSRKKPITASAE